MAATDTGPRLSWLIAEVREVIPETKRVTSLRLDIPGWRGHQPGQHVAIRLTGEDGYQAQRLYSIASAPEAPLVAITVERIDEGEVSPYLAGELRPGDRFELRGPIGGYFVWTAAAGGPLLLIAGGSGIAPLMAMLRHRAAAGSPAEKLNIARELGTAGELRTAGELLAKNSPPLPGERGRGEGAVPTRLLYSSRTADDIIYRDELTRLAAKDDGLVVWHTLTREQPAGWTGGTRRIDRAMLAERGFPPAEKPQVFICGPNGLVESAAQQLIDLGHDPQAIRTERFGPTA